MLSFLHGGEKIYYVVNALGLVHQDPGTIESVVTWCWSQIPSVDAVGSPGLARIWIFVDDDSCDWRCEWRSIEIEGAVQLGVGGSIEFTCDSWSRLRVRRAWGGRLSQSCRGNFGSVTQSPAMN